MKRILVFGLLLSLSLGCFSQNKNGRYNSQFNDCSSFGNDDIRHDRLSFITANFAYGIKPSMSFGLTFGMIRRFGWFVSLMTGTEFHSFNVDGEFDRDDSATQMPFLYGDSYKSNTRLSLMVGGLAKIAKPLALKFGVGYGINELCYEGPENTWFLDKKYSKRGLDVSLGLQCNIKKLVVSAEAVATDFDMIEEKIGVGFRF